jgi:hypothetical protein
LIKESQNSWSLRKWNALKVDLDLSVSTAAEKTHGNENKLCQECSQDFKFVSDGRYGICTPFQVARLPEILCFLQRKAYCYFSVSDVRTISTANVFQKGSC